MEVNQNVNATNSKGHAKPLQQQQQNHQQQPSQNKKRVGVGDAGATTSGTNDQRKAEQQFASGFHEMKKELQLTAKLDEERRAQLREQQALNDKLRRQIVEQERIITTLKMRAQFLHSMRAQFEEHNAELTRRVTDMTKDIDMVEERMADLVQSNAQVNDALNESVQPSVMFFQQMTDDIAQYLTEHSEEKLLAIANAKKEQILSPWRDQHMVDLASCNMQLEEARAKCTELEKRKTRAQEINSKHSEPIALARARTTELGTDIDNLRAKIEQMKKKTEEKHAEKEQLVARKAACEEAVKFAKEQLKASRVDHQNLLFDTCMQISETQEKSEKAADQCKNLKTQLEELVNREASLTSAKRDALETIPRLQHEVPVKQSELANAEYELSELGQQLTSLQTQVQTKTIQLEERRAKNSQAQQEIIAASERVDRLRTEVAQAQAKGIERQSELASKRDALSASKSVVVDLQKQVTDVEQALKEISNKRNELKQAINEKNELFTRMVQDEQKQQEQLGIVQKQIDDVQKKIGQKREELNIAKNQCEELQREQDVTDNAMRLKIDSIQKEKQSVMAKLAEKESELKIVLAEKTAREEKANLEMADMKSDFDRVCDNKKSTLNELRKKLTMMKTVETNTKRALDRDSKQATANDKKLAALRASVAAEQTKGEALARTLKELNQQMQAHQLVVNNNASQQPDIDTMEAMDDLLMSHAIIASNKSQPKVRDENQQNTSTGSSEVQQQQKKILRKKSSRKRRLCRPADVLRQRLGSDDESMDSDF